jgi:hypothetical protein
LKVDSKEFDLQAVIKEELSPGTAGLPYNLSELAEIKWPAKGILTIKNK